jgi:two-component system chemotaxis sensor kinase CheA
MDNFYSESADKHNTEHISTRESLVNDYVQEIFGILDSIELELVNIEVDPDNPGYVDAIYHGFHTIKGMACFLEEGISAAITEHTEELLEACQKFNITITRSITNILLQSILFLRKIYKDKQILTDTKFQGEVSHHIGLILQLKDGIMLDIKQPFRSEENKIGEILLEDGALNQNDIEFVLDKQNSMYRDLKFGEIALREKKVDVRGLIRAIRTQKIRSGSGDQYVQIPVKRLDQIVQVADQLKDIQEELHDELVLRFGTDDGITVKSRQGMDLFSGIRSIIQELRLVTFKQSFQKLTRAVRAMIEDAGLNVVFSILGENVEVNKEIAEDIIKPLAKIIEFLLESFSTDFYRDNIDKLEVEAYKEGKSLIIELSGNRSIDIDSINKEDKLREAEIKIKILNGRIEYQNSESNGFKIKITIPQN